MYEQICFTKIYLDLLCPESANKFALKSLIALSSCCVQGSLFTPPCNAYFASHSDAYEHVLTIANLISVYFSIFLTFTISNMIYGFSCNSIVFSLCKGFFSFFHLNFFMIYTSLPRFYKILFQSNIFL